jgi:hypothetical protein
MAKKITLREVMTDEEYEAFQRFVRENTPISPPTILNIPFGSFVSIEGELYQKIKQEDGDQNYFVKHSPVARMAFSLKNSGDWENSDIHWVLNSVESKLRAYLDEDGGVTIFSKKEVEENKKILDLDTENCSYFWTRSPYSDNAVREWRVSASDASHSVSYYLAFVSFGVSPALWLKKDLVIKSGSGSKDDPYIVLPPKKEEND